MDKGLIALIDADTPAIAAAIASETASESWVATSRLDRTIENILLSVGVTEYKLFVSGKDNFRKILDSEYKANRTAPDPKWREVCKQHLITKWGATEAHGCEADDYCGIYQTSDTVICGIDKDLLQIPGMHWSWDIVRGGKIIRPATYTTITPLQGLRNFYKQMLTGDTSDNIKGIDGIGPVKAGKLIDHLETEEEMAEIVYDLYFSRHDFYTNADLLWIMRELGVVYSERDSSN